MNGLPIHKGEVVEFVRGSYIKLGYLQDKIPDKNFSMYEVRDKKTNKLEYVFEIGLLREIPGRLRPATESWTRKLMEELGL